MKKNKIGFTLIEMMTVVAIIILLTTALTFSVSTYMGKTRSVSSAAESHVNKYDEAKNSVNALNPTPPATPPPITSTPTPGATPSSYIVTFVYKDASGDDTSSQQTVNTGSDAEAPAIPIRPDYTFTVWTPATFTNIQGNTTVNAQYTINSYTVIFVDGYGNTLNTQTVNYGSAATAPTNNPTHTGYTFSSWNTATFNNITADLTVTALWTATVSSYTVTFVNGFGVTIGTPQSVASGGSATAPANNPVKTGYTFASWDTDYTNVTTNLTVTAKWRFTVRLYVNHTQYDSDYSNITVTSGDPYNMLTTPSRNGYLFDGWWTGRSDGTQIDSGTTVSVTDTTNNRLYAHWIEQCTITFDANGGTLPNGTINPITVADGSAYGQLPIPTKIKSNNPTKYYTFGGWWTYDYGGSQVYSNTTVTGDQELHARWQ